MKYFLSLIYLLMPHTVRPPCVRKPNAYNSQSKRQLYIRDRGCFPHRFLIYLCFIYCSKRPDLSQVSHSLRLCRIWNTYNTFTGVSCKVCLAVLWDIDTYVIYGELYNSHNGRFGHCMRPLVYWSAVIENTENTILEFGITDQYAGMNCILKKCSNYLKPKS